MSPKVDGSNPSFPTNGLLVQMARTLDLHSRGREFESHTVHKCILSSVGREVVIEEVASKSVTFDLIGEIATVTRLTRKTVATILQNIEPAIFKLFATNPEEFIREAIKLINEQKASTIIEHISYDKVEEAWNAEEIFADPTISGEYGKNVIDSKKHLFDKLRYDSGIERDLAVELDVAENVELYIKLPSGFFINTPMGKYNPDWAITFREGSVKILIS